MSTDVAVSPSSSSLSSSFDTVSSSTSLLSSLVHLSGVDYVPFSTYKSLERESLLHQHTIAEQEFLLQQQKQEINNLKLQLKNVKQEGTIQENKVFLLQTKMKQQEQQLQQYQQQQQQQQQQQKQQAATQKKK